ncbi:MAG: pirin family protein [Nitrospinales bacterium]
MTLEVLHRDDLKLGGFGGLTEHRIIMDPRAFGQWTNPRTWEGKGNFVYLADAQFDPKGETGMHNHREIDVISVMVEGRISHNGSLEHGTELSTLDVQTQRAGGEGFSHNEINPDDVKNRMIQMWVLPDTPERSADYKVYHPEWGEVMQIYGGTSDQDKTFDSSTIIKVGLLNQKQDIELKTDFLAYLAVGSGIANNLNVEEGDMFRGSSLKFHSLEKSQLIIIHT